MKQNIIRNLIACAAVMLATCASPAIADTLHNVTTWKFYEEADDVVGLNLAAWEEWSMTDVAFWVGMGINMAIPVDGNLSVDDVVLIAGTYSGYGLPQVVSDEWMFARHYSALKNAVGREPYGNEQGAYGMVFEDDVGGRNYSLSLDIWPERKVVSERQWILLEIGGDPTKGCKTFYLGVKGRDDAGYSRFRIYATPDQGVSQDPSNWSSQRELAVLPVPIGCGTTSGSGMYESGTQVELSATPESGYEFEGWFDQETGQLLGTAARFNYVTTGANRTIFARFVQKKVVVKSVLMLWEAAPRGVVSAVASTYDGYLCDANRNVKGTILVKVGKTNTKTGLAAVKATMIGLDGKKTTLKAENKGMAAISAEGPTTVSLAGGEACVVTLGASEMSGTYGSYFIDGSRNVFASRDATDKAVAFAALSKWQGVVNMAWQGENGWNSLSVNIAARGKARVNGALADGTKVSATGQLVVGEKWCCVPVLANKMGLPFTVWLPLNVQDSRSPSVVGIANAIVDKPGTLKSAGTFKLGAVMGDAKYEAYLPNGMQVGGGAKWTLPKAGRVQLTKDGAVDKSKLGENPSALKLTYKAKDGTFRGSFKSYADVNGKLKATTVNVSGVLVGGVGFGVATVRGGGGVAVMIE